MTTTTAERLTSASPDLPPMLYGYAAIHHAMHRDAARLVRTLAATPADPAKLEQWWTAVRDAIVHHHVREDDIIWPALAAADPTFADEVATMHDDHHELDDAMHRLDVALVALCSFPNLALWPEALPEARAAAAAFQRVLTDHVAREEEVAFHRLAQRPQLWAEIDEQLARGITLREAAFALPFIHDALHPSRSSYLMQKVPAFARPINRFLWRPRYDRLVAAAHATKETR